MDFKKLGKKFKKLDYFPKFKDEAIEKSYFGAGATIFGILLFMFLFFSELADYEVPDRMHTITVNTDRQKNMTINFRIAFLAIPCDYVYFDFTDKIGGDKIDVGGEEIKKVPFRADFNPLKKAAMVNGGWAALQSLWHLERHLWNELLKRQLPPTDQRCLPCYEFDGCCNNCFSMKVQFAMKGISVENTGRYPQCQEPVPEGCLVSGAVNVNMVQGGFHISAGNPHGNPEFGHHHDWPVEIRPLGFNSTHYISQLTFGQEYPGKENPLDGFLSQEDTIGQTQYFLQVVPTVFSSDATYVRTNQYSATWHFNEVTLDEKDHFELPGVFFRYDISSLQIAIEYKYTALAHLFTRLLAIFGGVWAIFGMLYTAFSNAYNVVRKKKE